MEFGGGGSKGDAIPRPRCGFWLVRGLSPAAVDHGKVGDGDATGGALGWGCGEWQGPAMGKAVVLYEGRAQSVPLDGTTLEKPHGCSLDIHVEFLSDGQGATRCRSLGFALAQVPHSCLPGIPRAASLRVREATANRRL
jgi:hypothetical protein